MRDRRPRNLYEFRDQAVEAYDLAMAGCAVGEGEGGGTGYKSGCPHVERGIDLRDVLVSAIHLHDRTTWVYRVLLDHVRWSVVPRWWRDKAREDFDRVEKYLMNTGYIEV